MKFHPPFYALPFFPNFLVTAGLAVVVFFCIDFFGLSSFSDFSSAVDFLVAFLGFDGVSAAFFFGFSMMTASSSSSSCVTLVDEKNHGR